MTTLLVTLLACTALAAPALAQGAQPPAPIDPSDDALLADLGFEKDAPPNRVVIDLAPRGNRRRMPLTLDTGAVQSLMTPRIAKALGVSIRANMDRPYRRATALGRDLLFHVDARRSDTAASGPFEYGLLGGEFLQHFVVELDFRGRHVRFYDPDRYEVPASSSAQGEAVLPLTLVSHRPAIEAHVNGRPLTLVLDTGAPPPLILSGAFARQVGLESQPLEGFALSSIAGPIETEVGRADSVALGPLVLKDVTTAVGVHGIMNFGFPGDSLVGYDLLAQFLVRIDYPRRRLFLRRDPEATFAYDASRPRAPVETAAAIPPEPPDAMQALAPRDEPDPQQVWLEWGAPAPGERVEGPVGWVEVRGWAGVGNPVQHDVVIVIDVSGSTALASGVDVDGDGTLGRQRQRIDPLRSFNPRHYSSDLDDTVLSAELLATRRLVELLDPDRTRIGLVAFASGARILAPLGSDTQRIDRMLRDMESGFGSGSTNLADAITRASEVLQAGETAESQRRKTVLVLSDGWPTTPGTPRLAAEKALEAARAAADRGVRLHTFGLGLEAAEGEDVYAQVARLSGGESLRLQKPGEIVYELPRVDLADVAGVEIENLDTGSGGRAVRVRPDGSFDGFLLLADGENRVRVTARGDTGRERSDERVVVFDQRAPRDAGEAATFDARVLELKKALARRRIETELVKEIEASRRQRAELVIGVEEAEPESAP